MIPSFSAPPRSHSAFALLVIATAAASALSFTAPLRHRHHQGAAAVLTRRAAPPMHATTTAMSAVPDDGSGSGGSVGVASEARSLGLFGTTPLLYSPSLTDLCATGNPVYLKLDLLQRSGSFKDRGVGHLCATLRKMKGPDCRLVSSSGGNAGLAVTTVGRCLLGMHVSVVVPETTKELVVARLRELGAEVFVHGKNWNEADALARTMVREDVRAEYISPYDNPLLWTGHSTVVDEVLDQLPLAVGDGSSSTTATMGMGAIVASVGGGGLLCGIFEGIERNHFGPAPNSEAVRRVKVVACETEGAASFAAAYRAGSPVRLEGIETVATSLGALEVTPATLSRATRHKERGGEVVASVCSDREAVEACIRFAADHRMLVEPACGAALAAIYSERLREETLKGVEEGQAIVVEVCGGSGVNLDLLGAWKKQFLEE